jgi:hypothetical protein
MKGMNEVKIATILHAAFQKKSVWAKGRISSEMSFPDRMIYGMLLEERKLGHAA